MTIKKKLIGAAVAVAVALPGANYVFGPASASETLVSGCVLRFDTPDGSPRIHANYSHHCTGVSAVFINKNGDLEVTQTMEARNAVVFAFAQADETLVARDIQVGASGGINRTVYRFYDGKLGRKLNLRSASDRMRIQGNSSNLWVGWVNKS